MAKKKKSPKSVEHLKHEEASRKNIPPAEYQSMVSEDVESPIQVAYERRNRDLDPQLVWRGKDEQDWSDLVVQAPPLYIQEKIHPKVLIEDLKRRSGKGKQSADTQMSLFEDFNGMEDQQKETEFYQHDKNWTNRMILGDSLQVMASLAEREGLRGKVQCIYIDPPYGIKFNSNFQWSTTSRTVTDGKAEHITREPEQVKAFRDTWRDGIHSYLTYLRDRLMVARDLLADSGSIFVQIGDENVHRVRVLMDEIFGDENFVRIITYKTTSGLSQDFLDKCADYILWYAKDISRTKYRELFQEKSINEELKNTYSNITEDVFNIETIRVWEKRNKSILNHKNLPKNAKLVKYDNLKSQSGEGGEIKINGIKYTTNSGSWKTNQDGINHLWKANRIKIGSAVPAYVRYHNDFPAVKINNIWYNTGTGGDYKGFVMK